MRTWCRNGVYYVYIQGEGWKSSKCNNRDDALAWAGKREKEKIRKKRTVRGFTETMFLPGQCDLLKVWADQGRGLKPSSVQRYRRHLTARIWPKFGSRLIGSITRAEFRVWLAGLDLMPDTKNKILSTAKAVFDWAEECELLDHSPVDKIKYYNVKKKGASKVRGPFTLEEIRKLFPEDRDEALRIHGSQKWLVFRLIQADTGKRPGEIAALKWGVWKQDKHLLLVYRSVDPQTATIQETVKSEAGIGIVSPRTEQELLLWQYASPHTGPDDLIFEATESGPIRAETSLKNFKSACKRAKIDRRGRPQYSLRHAFATDVLSLLPGHLVSKLMQHADTKSRESYDHRSIEQRLMDEMKEGDIDAIRKIISKRLG